MYINFFCFYRERERALAQAGAPVIQPQRTDGPRFTGGGFNLKSTKTAAWLELSQKIADPAFLWFMDSTISFYTHCKISSYQGFIFWTRQEKIWYYSIFYLCIEQIEDKD